ncbi:MCE family protein [Nocardia alba]|uniref:Virulence factor Mce-like protein n=2 Tax=Nocardia alba TaxID=225051 RepID=A0A4R1FCX0_9NOCA|nr:MlaD family protein [Nocardia alba]TCJ89698.1 virulence factor Mce-like protein [Nocardia alba]
MRHLRSTVYRSFRPLALAAASIAIVSCSMPGQESDTLDRSTEITADFENIAGMYEGNEVMVLGLAVGTVDKIVPKGTYVEVHMTIDADVKIPKDAIAAIISPSIVTDRHIEITPPYTGGDAMESGRHLTKANTRTPIELDTMIKTIDQFAAALEPEPGQEGLGPLSGRVSYPVVNGNGQKIRETLDALSSVLEVGVDNKDAIAVIIIKLNELMTMLADNDQSVRDFSNRMTATSELLAEQGPGLQATLDQLNAFLANTSTTFGEHADTLSESLTGLTTVTNQLRANSGAMVEIIDILPLLMQNVDGAMNKEDGFVRIHALIGTVLSGEIVSVFCERIQMKSDGCRSGNMQDFGPDYGLTAALLGLTK